MLNQEVIVNQQLQEQIIYEDPSFPLGRFIDQLDNFAGGTFLCHCHAEFELALVLKGCVEYQLEQTAVRLSSGEGIFINSKALHSARQLVPDSVIFNIEFLSSLFNTVITSSLYQKYFNPVAIKNTTGCQILPDTKEGSEILRCLMNIHNSTLGEFAYELSCMENVLHIWRNLLSLIKQTEAAPLSPDDILREHRMRKMVAFIQSHFDSPITIEDIAASTNISRSECFRCFSIFCSTAPMEYVNRYRLQYAAQKLSTTGDSISDICFASGFSSVSYFGKAFRKAYELSPSDYRKKELASNAEIE